MGTIKYKSGGYWYNISNILWPVGSIYLSTQYTSSAATDDNDDAYTTYTFTSPSNFLGGTWTLQYHNNYPYILGTRSRLGSAGAVWDLAPGSIYGLRYSSSGSAMHLYHVGIWKRTALS